MGRKRGLSLLEVVIAMSITLTVFFTAYQVFITGFRFHKTTEYSTKLTKMAQKKLEEIVKDRRPEGPAATSWASYDDPAYRFMVTVAATPSAPPHYNDVDPLYDIYCVTLTSEGPLNPNGTKGTMSQTMVLKTYIAPQVPFHVNKCSSDENNANGSSGILQRFGGCRP